MVTRLHGIALWGAVLSVVATSLGAVRLSAQKPPKPPKPKFVINYDESKAGNYTLPDPLLLQNGERVRDAATWTAKRRPELLHLFQENIYGRTPQRRLPGLHWKVFNVDRHALNGLATRKQVMIYFTRNENGPKMDMLVYIPNSAHKPVPMFLCMSFAGLNTIVDD
ncbi:MAG: acetylxylan esterase, partial [Acidobacteriota bacterium]|nr:acetylxylan esterase [Acidobacteriota bacterium]